MSVQFAHKNIKIKAIKMSRQSRCKVRIENNNNKMAVNEAHTRHQRDGGRDETRDETRSTYTSCEYLK